MLIPVIVSGGAGTRLWPVSRQSRPKPFLALPGGDTLLARTLARARAVADADAPILTVTGAEHYFLTRDEYARHPDGADRELPFLLEPVGRNTAPAVLAAALLARRQWGEDAILLVLPADHLIADVAAFGRDVAQARALAAQGWLVTFGLLPQRPETGFGYIHGGDAIVGSGGREIAAFVEKPDLATAQGYLASGGYYWNSGMFCLGAARLVEVAAEVAPELLAAVAAAVEATPVPEEAPVWRLPTETFAQVPDISIDYAIMERAARRAVVPSRFDWNDIGSWDAIGALVPTDPEGNRVLGDAIVVGSRNSDVHVTGRDRVVALVGVEDLIVVDTADAVLVAARDRVQDVREVVGRLKRDAHPAALLHQTVERPWGSYTVLEDAADCKVKRLVVKPGQVLSLQLHHRRSEHWTVVQGTAKVRVGDEEFLLERNQSTYIPVETLHRLENPTDRDIALIEVQCGDYFGEDDIVRYEDIYGRR